MDSELDKDSNAVVERSPLAREIGVHTSVILVLLFALLIRVLMSLHPYSGVGHPPMYGDYEAQRHWMEITLHTPPSQWYHNTTDNPLSYWGLDYPPLTAYQSWIHGLLLHHLHPESVALNSSRGHESSLGKLLMRWTVLLSDGLIFFPAAIYFVFVYCFHGGRKEAAPWLLAMILLNPALVIIDHGHFQYNCISLGFTVAAVGAILSNHELLGSVLFTLALNHKQMSAYFAPAIFAHLLGKCLQRKSTFLEISKLGLAVLITFALIWWPYIYSLEACIEVLSRLAPFERGIYEDYVGNFWCSTSMLIKWRRLFTVGSLKILTFVATLLGFLPSVIQQIKAPSDLGFLYALLNSSLSFYLFSFQVHEKSILLPMLPASLLSLEEPYCFKLLVYYGLFSMFPLICRDNLVLGYLALVALFALIYHSRKGPSFFEGLPLLKSRWLIFPFSVSLVLHLFYLILQSPRRYPFLFEALIIVTCFSQFLMIFCYTNVKQWMALNHPVKREKKFV